MFHLPQGGGGRSFGLPDGILDRKRRDQVIKQRLLDHWWMCLDPGLSGFYFWGGGFRLPLLGGGVLEGGPPLPTRRGWSGSGRSQIRGPGWVSVRSPTKFLGNAAQLNVCSGDGDGHVRAGQKGCRGLRQRHQKSFSWAPRRRWGFGHFWPFFFLHKTLEKIFWTLPTKPIFPLKDPPHYGRATPKPPQTHWGFKVPHTVPVHGTP